MPGREAATGELRGTAHRARAVPSDRRAPTLAARRRADRAGRSLRRLAPDAIAGTARVRTKSPERDAEQSRGLHGARCAWRASAEQRASGLDRARPSLREAARAR